ncbi:MAG: hypothetical protein ACE5MM_08665 [Nitrospiraceae bacterium]
METLRSVAEIAFGVLHGVGAVFNTVYTLRNYAEFYGSFANGAWFGPAESLIRNVVIPNGTLFTVLLIVFQAAIAIAILTRGDLVQPALFAGGVFALAVAFFSSPGGAAANLALAAIQFALALTR